MKLHLPRHQCHRPVFSAMDIAISAKDHAISAIDHALSAIDIAISAIDHAIATLSHANIAIDHTIATMDHVERHDRHRSTINPHITALIKLSYNSPNNVIHMLLPCWTHSINQKRPMRYNVSPNVVP